MTGVTRRAVGWNRLERLDFLVYWRGGGCVASLAPGQVLVVGREAPAELRLDANGLSRQHARLSWGANGPTVEDLGSTNGTLLNGQKTRAAPIAPGDALTLGEVTIGVVGGAAGDPLPVLVEGFERFVDRLEAEVVRARTFQRPFGVLRLRALDGSSLTAAAPLLRTALRPVDALGAYGSGELLALLPEADPAAAARAGRALLLASPVKLGVATAAYPTDGADAQALLAVVAAGARQLSPKRTLRHAVLAPEPAGAVLHSDALRALFALGRKVAATPLPVLIQGETGSGKEVLARAIHDASPRAKAPFVAINCAAIPATLLESTLFGHERGAFTGADRRKRGVFELADGGTLFLDELGELSLAAQAGLLRVLETRQFSRVGGEAELTVDVRLLAATHRDLDAAVAAGVFRADLRFRLEGVTLRLPALRERPEDVLPLARHFLAMLGTGKVTGFTPEAEDAMRAYAWPGNVRELRNAIERGVAVANGVVLELGDLPDRVAERHAAMPRPAAAAALVELPDGQSFEALVAERRRELERRLILEALAQTGGNQTRAARRLHLPLRTLVYKLKALGLHKRRGG